MADCIADFSALHCSAGAKIFGMLSPERIAICIELHCSRAIFGMMSSECVAVCIALHCTGAKLHS